MEDRDYWLGLSTIRGIGPIRLNNLIKYFKEPVKIWKAPERELRRVNGIGELAGKIVEQRKGIKLSELKDKLQEYNIEYLTLTDPEYPKYLKNIYDPPPVIYYQGDYILNEPAVAIVGSRRSTTYGRKVAERLAYELAIRGITVVSGMARGIDTRGHKGALNADGKTIAVLGSGLNVIYPPENAALFKEITAKGMVISEFPPDVEPLPGNFPQRNRIISGLSQGVVVVEASTRSGSLITAGLALEQGRELFAVPGNIDRPGSRGTNDLIKKGAKLVSNVQDVLEELFIYTEIKNNVKDPQLQKQKPVYPELTAGERKLIRVLQDEGVLHINQLIERSKMKASEVNIILLKMELKGLVKRETGKKYSFLGLQSLLKPL